MGFVRGGGWWRISILLSEGGEAGCWGGSGVRRWVREELVQEFRSFRW